MAVLLGASTGKGEKVAAQAVAGRKTGPVRAHRSAGNRPRQA